MAFYLVGRPGFETVTSSVASGKDEIRVTAARNTLASYLSASSPSALHHDKDSWRTRGARQDCAEQAICLKRHRGGPMTHKIGGRLVSPPGSGLRHHRLRHPGSNPGPATTSGSMARSASPRSGSRAPHPPPLVHPSPPCRRDPRGILTNSRRQVALGACARA